MGLGEFVATLLAGLVAGAVAHQLWRRERTRSERARIDSLAASQGELQAVFDHSFEFITLMGVDGTLLRTNRTALKFAGIAAEDVVGKPFWETPWWTHAPELQDRLREAVRKAAQGDLVRFEATHRQPNGLLAHIDLTVKPVQDGHGAVRFLISEGRDITARKEAEEQLRESNQFNQQIVASAPNGVVVLDSAFRYQVWNPHMEAISGVPASAVMGKRPLDLFPFLETTGIYPMLERALAGETAISGDFPFAVPSSGRKGWAMQVMGPLRNAQNEITGVLVSVVDTTDRKATEEKLREAGRKMEEALALLNTLQTAAPVGLGFVDMDFRYLRCNEALAEINGLPAAEQLGRTVCDVVPKLWPQLEPLYQHVRSGKGPIVNREVVGETAALPGETRSWQVSYYPVQIRDEIIGTGIIVSEITERKRVEEELRQERLQLAGIVNSAMDGIITIDESQHIVLFNPAAENIFHYRADDVVGQPLDILLPERFRSIHFEHIEEFGKRNMSPYETCVGRATRGLRANGDEIPVEASVSQHTLGGRKFFTVTCRDVTERVRAEETRQKLEAQLLQSQKMEAIGQLAGGIAHDFNNLLTVIAGYTEVLLHALAPGDALSESVRSIREASDRASSLTRQLLMFSRQHPSESRVLDFNELVAASEKMLRRVIGEDILFTVSLDPTIGCIKADPAQLNQVLMNLVVNARDAMPRGGSLTVETHAINNVGVLLPGNTSLKSGILLKVSDTGTGMTPDVAARIFDPFFTTKGVGKGTGLGLAVVHGIVEQCGGRIEVNSAPGTGTTFQIFLPVYSESSLPQSAGESEPAPRGSETILLVEDDEAVRKLALLSLTGQGYRVLPAVDGQDALRIVNEHPQPIDMLLTDVVMPNMDGLELAQHLQARFPGMKILFVSGYSGDAVTQRGMSQEELVLLPKPYTPASLVRKVRELLDASAL